MAADVLTSGCQSPTNQRSPRLSTRPLVYITRCIPQTGLETLLGVCDVKHWDSELPVPRGEMLHSVYRAAAILCLPSDIIDVGVLDAAGPSLRVIASLSTSCTHIDTIECARRGVQVITVPKHTQGGTSGGAAGLTMALMLGTLKHSLADVDKPYPLTLPMPDLLQSTPENLKNFRPRLLSKQNQENLAFQLSNGRPINPNCDTSLSIARKTIGVFGINELGFSVIKALNTYGFKTVLATSMDVGLDNRDIIHKSDMDFDIVDFDEFLARSEVICICSNSAPKRKKCHSFSSDGNDEHEEDEEEVDDLSRVVFNKDTFKKMRNNAILITSQSEESSVDYIDLYAALRDGQIRAAGLNDCNQEPVPFKIPLSGLGNCVFLPQSEESVYDARHEMAQTIARSLIDTLKNSSARMTRLSSSVSSISESD